MSTTAEKLWTWPRSWPTHPTASWCAAAPAAWARRPPRRQWRCAPPNTAAPSCVLTIDPAKRLAQALGVNDLGNTPQRVPLAPEVSGELHAMMLDMRRTFDEMVIQYSGSERAQAILDNQFYQTVATSLAGTQEYMAMEKLGQLLAAGPLGPGGGGHSAVAQRAGLPGRAKTVGQLHG